MNDKVLDTAVGCLVNLVRDEIRRFDMAETQLMHMSDEARQEVMDGIALRCEPLLNDLVEMVETQGFRAVRATLEAVTFKDGVKAVLKMSEHEEHRHVLADAAGGHVQLLIPLNPLELGLGDGSTQQPIDFSSQEEDEDEAAL